MAVERTPAQARALFAAAWTTQRDDYDACIAAHYLARHQPTVAATLACNARAVHHAAAVTDGLAAVLLPSLHVHLADLVA